MRPKCTHTTLLVLFFLTKVEGNSAKFSLNERESLLASCLVSCRVAPPIFSSVYVQYTGETIYRDKENAFDMIMGYPNNCGYIATPVYRPPLECSTCNL